MEKPNFDYIKELAGGDEVFEKKLLAIMVDEFPKEKEKYYNSLALGDQKLIIEIVHKLKHKISILGLKKSYETAVEYENNLRVNSSDLENEFKETLSVMTQFLASL
ncbi:Hpt domain-containing protein [Wenyingzhuangia sp. chi5]|uniref:Hpt domain-containing protein n=1 Tax=Wenyingzhuangia gilva TaxID=3057677 RepID=A0ABT8VTV4_9FLAO|nr:Hpt domain-containing protein [Wenyingzhuangia sp. chi5]MDO3695407.1 Hpt domain-containing protein [Wenyingzhuangia sp. chi5]